MCATSLGYYRPTKTPSGYVRQQLVFLLGGQAYGIDLAQVREFKIWAETDRLVDANDPLRGIMDLRGQAVPVYDLNKPFHGTPTLIGDSHIVIVLEVEQQVIGLAVDTLSDLIELGSNDIASLPNHEAGKGQSFVSGVVHRDGKMIALLDVSSLVTCNTTH